MSRRKLSKSDRIWLGVIPLYIGLVAGGFIAKPPMDVHDAVDRGALLDAGISAIDKEIVEMLPARRDLEALRDRLSHVRTLEKQIWDGYGSKIIHKSVQPRDYALVQEYRTEQKELEGRIEKATSDYSAASGASIAASWAKRQPLVAARDKARAHVAAYENDHPIRIFFHTVAAGLSCLLLPVAAVSAFLSIWAMKERFQKH